MSNNEAIEYLEQHGMISDEVKDIIFEVFLKVSKYEKMEKRLRKIYGEYDELLEIVVNSLERHENLDLPYITVKSRLLTDEQVDIWDAYKAIGTVEEFKTLKEKSVAKKPRWHGHYFCPHCNNIVYVNGGRNIYCPYCGQKIDWKINNKK